MQQHGGERRRFPPAPPTPVRQPAGASRVNPAATSPEPASRTHTQAPQMARSAAFASPAYARCPTLRKIGVHQNSRTGSMPPLLRREPCIRAQNQMRCRRRPDGEQPGAWQKDGRRERRHEECEGGGRARAANRRTPTPPNTTNHTGRRPSVPSARPSTLAVNSTAQLKSRLASPALSVQPRYVATTPAEERRWKNSRRQLPR